MTHVSQPASMLRRMAPRVCGSSAFRLQAGGSGAGQGSSSSSIVSLPCPHASPADAAPADGSPAMVSYQHHAIHYSCPFLTCTVLSSQRRQSEICNSVEQQIVLSPRHKVLRTGSSRLSSSADPQQAALDGLRRGAIVAMCSTHRWWARDVDSDRSPPTGCDM